MISFKQFIAEGTIKDSSGFVKWGWKKDLADEESDEYLPPGYSYDKVIELSMVQATTPGQGDGAKLMKKFLASPDLKKAELVFLDPNPGEGANAESAELDHVQVQRLKKFYSRFGFKSNGKANRMWLVLKGSIPSDQLPS